MAKLKYTKNALREEQRKFKQLEIYLPTLKLKKKLLQFEVSNSKEKIENLKKELSAKKNKISEFSSLLTSNEALDILKYFKVKHINKSYENIAGIEIPNFEGVEFQTNEYFLFDTPIWMDSLLNFVRELIEIKQKTNVEEEKKRALLKELKDVSIRVNLFEKVLIPKTINNIRKVKIFLNDQELAAVSRAKIAKKKILEKKAV